MKQQIKITQTSNADMNIGFNKRLTALEWLKDMLEWNYGDPQMLEITWENLDDLLERAKSMEKEQIQKAFSDGQETPLNHPTLPHYSREEYYKDTYNK